MKMPAHHTPITSLHYFQSTLFLLIPFSVTFLLPVIQVTRLNLSGYASEKKEWAFMPVEA